MSSLKWESVSLDLYRLQLSIGTVAIERQIAFFGLSDFWAMKTSWSSIKRRLDSRTYSGAQWEAETWIWAEMRKVMQGIDELMEQRSNNEQS